MAPEFFEHDVDEGFIVNVVFRYAMISHFMVALKRRRLRLYLFTSYLERLNAGMQCLSHTIFQIRMAIQVGAGIIDKLGINLVCVCKQSLLQVKFSFIDFFLDGLVQGELVAVGRWLLVHICLL